MASSTPELYIHFTKRADGRAVIQCARPDGTTTWRRLEGNDALFYPFHDLTHFAVETTLGFRHGFYGLLADGWDITDTDGKGARGRLPAEGILVEHVVALFDRERLAGGAPFTAEEFNAELALSTRVAGIEGAPTLTDAELTVVRDLRNRLHHEWTTLTAGATMELRFDRYSGTTA